ncbi:MAG TPA: MFS transporter [Jatrophihabitantaceae bacterium]|nr:MFS transporter [Jatrophihabitantaceae bacterium]
MTTIARTTRADAAPEPAGTRTLRSRDLVVLSIGTFTLGVDGFVLSGLLPQVAASLHVSPSTAGQLTTLFALVYAVGSPVIAALTGNWNRRTVLAAGMTLFVVGVIAQAVGNTFALVAAGRVIAALGAAGYQATAYSTAGILSDDQRRARSLAVVAGGSSVAIVAGLPFGIAIGQHWGWRAAMWVLVALAVLSTVALATLPAAYAPRLSLRQRADALTDRRVLGILAGTVTMLTPGFLIIAYLPAIIPGSHWVVVAAMLGYGTGQVTGTALVPRIIGRAGGRAALFLGASMVTATVAALGASRCADGAAIATMAVLGAAVGLCVVPQQHRIFATVPTRAPVAVGLNGSAIYVASALGAGLGGLALAAGGALAACALAAAIGAVAVLVVATTGRDE